MYYDFFFFENVSALHGSWLASQSASTHFLFLPDVSNSWLPSFPNLPPLHAAIILLVFLTTLFFLSLLKNSLCLPIQSILCARPNQIILLDLINWVMSFPFERVSVCILQLCWILQFSPSFMGQDIYFIILLS